MPKTLAEIEALAREYHVALSDLDRQVDGLEEEIAEAKERRLPQIRETVEWARQCRDELLEAVHASPEVFRKPKSQTLHRIRFGFRKAAGKVVIPDEEKTIDAIRRWFPARFIRLVNVTERANKTELAKLSGRDLKKLGVQLTNDTDEAFVKPVDGEVEKLAAALVNEGKDQ